MNIFDLPWLPLEDELITTLAENENVRIERIISSGQVSGWYDQSESEFIVLLEGSAKLEYEDGKTAALSKGDTLLIKPYEKHRVCYTSKEPPCIWICIFFK